MRIIGEGEKKSDEINAPPMNIAFACECVMSSYFAPYAEHTVINYRTSLYLHAIIKKAIVNFPQDGDRRATGACRLHFFRIDLNFN